MHLPNRHIADESEDSSTVNTPQAAPASVLPPSVRATDGELLLRFTQGEQAAFAKIIERHRRVVWLVCSQILRHHQDVEDALQATFLILARRAKTLRSADSLAAWLHRVAYHTAIRLLRNQKKHAAAPLSTEVEMVEDKLLHIQRSEERSVFLEELRSLPERFQTPLIMCYLEGQTRSAVADQLGCTTATIKGRLARGKSMLRARLLRRGIGLSVAMTAIAAPLQQAEAALSSISIAEIVTNCQAIHLGQPLPDGLSTQALTLSQQGVFAMTAATLAKPICVGVTLLGIVTATTVAAVQDKPAPRQTAATQSAGFELSEVVLETPESEAVKITAVPKVVATPPAPAKVTEPTTRNTLGRRHAVVRSVQPTKNDSQPAAVGVGFVGRRVGTPAVVQRAQPSSSPTPAPTGILSKETAKEIESLELAKRALARRVQGLELQAQARRVRAEAGATNKEKIDEAQKMELHAESVLLEAEALEAEAKILALDKAIEEEIKEQTLIAAPPIGSFSNAPIPAGPTDLNRLRAVPIYAPVPATSQPTQAVLGGPIGDSIPGPRTKITPGDRLRVEILVSGQLVTRSIVVEPSGSVALGVRYGRVTISGSTLVEAEEKIKKVLAEKWDNPEVQVTVDRKLVAPPATRVSR